MVQSKSFISDKLSLDDIDKSISKNQDIFVNNFFKMEFTWMVSAYEIFKDIEKYLIIVHLINKTLNTYNKYFFNFSYDQFYLSENIEIEKLSIIEIVKELNISKETARRKINELSKDNVIVRNSKKITLNKKAFIFQKPKATLKNLSKLLLVSAKNLTGNEILKSYNIEDFEEKIKKNYSRYWNTFLEFQISYMISGKKFFGDYESFLCIGVCSLNQSYNLLNSKNRGDLEIRDIADSIVLLEKSPGLNPTTISDLTGIPRATVIRKIYSLSKKKFIKKNDKNLYTISSPNLNPQAYKKLKERFNYNQNLIKNLITEFLNFIKS